MNLSPRLARVAELVSENVRMADIGTDHGYLPARLLKNGKIAYAIATDIHPRPLEKAVRLFERSGFKDVSECRLGAGLEPLQPGECDEIVVAGMGGLMIRDMLLESEAVARSLSKMIFQPMNNADVLRRFLSEHHFQIVHESIVQENDRFYEVMAVKNGEMPELSLEELYVGFQPVRHEDAAFEKYVSVLIEKTEHILSTVSQKTTLNAKKRSEECRALIFALQKLRRHDNGN